MTASFFVLSGSFNITVSNPDGSASNAWAVKVKPVWTSASPWDIPVGSTGLTLTFVGVGFTPSDSIMLDVGQTLKLATTYQSSTLLTAPIPDSALTKVIYGNAWVADSAAGTQSSTHMFSVAIPIVGEPAPTSVVAGGPGFTLKVSTSGTLPNAVLQWNGVPLPTTHLGDSYLSAPIAASLIATNGWANLTVVSGGVTSYPESYYIAPLPISIASISPVELAAGGPAVTVTIAGTGFLAGTAVTTGTTVLASTVINSTQLSVTVPASLTAIAGDIALTVTTPAGGVGQVDLYVYPLLTSVSPSTVMFGTSPLFTLTGAGFAPFSLVFLNGIIGNATYSITGKVTYVNSGMVKVQFDDTAFNDAGSRTISATTSGSGLAISPLTILVTGAPTVNALTPQSIAPGSAGFTLTVTGTGFISGVTVQ